MPLIMLTGYPCSGKSTIAKALATGLQAAPYTCSVTLLSDTELGYRPATTPSDVALEKMLRGSLLTATERQLTKTQVVIVDASHEIKGWRYQMHCLAKAVPTTHVLIHMATSVEQCAVWNAERAPTDQYEPAILTQLFQRYEMPNPATRWDAPLLTISACQSVIDDLPIAQIHELLFNKKPPVPNLATAPKDITEAGQPALLEAVTTSVLTAIQQAQARAGPTTPIRMAGWPRPLVLPRPVSLAEGLRLKRQFVQLNRLKPLVSESQLLASFLDYLGSMLT